jgi:hypothetical protein
MGLIYSVNLNERITPRPLVFPDIQYVSSCCLHQ